MSRRCVFPVCPGRWQALNAMAIALGALELCSGIGCRLSLNSDSPLTIAKVQQLSHLAGASGQAVAFRGVVTYADPIDQILLVQDSTGGLLIDVAGLGSLPPPKRKVAVNGIVVAMGGVPLVVHPSVTVIGWAPLPQAVPVRIRLLADRQNAGRRVKITGIALSSQVDSNGILRIRVCDGEEVATVRVRENTIADRAALPGAMVEIEGVSDPVKNDKGVVEDYRIWVVSYQDVRIVKPSVPLTAVPTVNTVELMHDLRKSGPPVLGRVQLHGEVREDARGGLKFADGVGILPLTMALDILPFTGRNLSIWAFPRRVMDGLVLEDAVVRVAEHPHPGNTHVVQRELLQAISQLRSLPAPEAAKGVPVDVEATVTYASEAWGLLFIQDSTGGIYVNVLKELPAGIRAGWRVRVEGRSSGGAFAPCISHARVTHLGESSLPEPLNLSEKDLVSGRNDSQWVQVDGVARSLETHDGLPIVHMVNGRTRFTAYLDGWSDPPQHLLGARLRLTGACGSSFNARRQFNGVEVYLQRPKQVRVLEPHRDPFRLAVRSSASLLQFSPTEEPSEEVHLQGIVTMATDSGALYVRDAGGGLQVLPARPVAARLGDLLDIAGYPRSTGLGVALEDATVHKLRTGHPPQPQHTSVYRILDGNLDGQLVELDGKLIGLVPALGQVQLLLNAAGGYFTTTLKQSEPFDAALLPGSDVRVRGICVLDRPTAVSENIARHFELHLRDANDIKVLRHAPWWTAERAFGVCAVGVAFLGAVLVWVFMLRRKVRQQTAIIAKKLEVEAERTQQLAEAAQELERLATRDGLTGMWNRTAVFDLLASALDRGRRIAQPTAVIMCDLDRFKQINDQYGHPIGDLVLQEISRRLRANVRTSDFVGRYGGEEFLIVLPECDLQEAVTRAEQLRNQIRSEPVKAGDMALDLTCSFGVSGSQISCWDSDQLIKSADEALYCAKRSGRDCVHYSVAGTEPSSGRICSQSCREMANGNGLRLQMYSGPA